MFYCSGTDRSNIVEHADPAKNYPTFVCSQKMFKAVKVIWTSHALKNPTPHDIAASMASSGHYGCAKNNRCPDNDNKPKMDDLLNNAPASYEGMLLQFTQKECYHYMCTRNNAFTNRSQKGRLCVKWFSCCCCCCCWTHRWLPFSTIVTMQAGLLRWLSVSRTLVFLMVWWLAVEVRLYVPWSPVRRGNVGR